MTKRKKLLTLVILVVIAMAWLIFNPEVFKKLNSHQVPEVVNQTKSEEVTKPLKIIETPADQVLSDAKEVSDKNEPLTAKPNGEIFGSTKEVFDNLDNDTTSQYKNILTTVVGLDAKTIEAASLQDSTPVAILINGDEKVSDETAYKIIQTQGNLSKEQLANIKIIRTPDGVTNSYMSKDGQIKIYTDKRSYVVPVYGIVKDHNQEVVYSIKADCGNIIKPIKPPIVIEETKETYVHIKGRKHWINDTADTRPSVLIIDLHVIDNKKNESILESITISAPEWSYDFKKRLASRGDQSWQYSIRERTVPTGYSVEYKGYDVFNHFTPPPPPPPPPTRIIQKSDNIEDYGAKKEAPVAPTTLPTSPPITPPKSDNESNFLDEESTKAPNLKAPEVLEITPSTGPTTEVSPDGKTTDNVGDTEVPEKPPADLPPAIEDNNDVNDKPIYIGND